MSETSGKCGEVTSLDTPKSIYLPELEAGHSLSDSPDGLRINLSGPEAAPASPLASPVKGSPNPTLATSGLSSPASSATASLQSSLENKLRAKLAAYGSPEYELTWKHWDMPSGPPILARRASARRTSGNAYIGWPTPQAHDTHERGNTMADHHHYPHDLPNAAQMAGWATPTSRDHKDAASDLTNTPVNGLLGRQALISTASTEKRGALNPEFSRWLMGFPPEWGSCAPTAMPSSRRSRQSS